MPFTASHGLEHSELGDAVFNARVIERGLAFVSFDSWATRARTLELAGQRHFKSVSRWGLKEIVEAGEAIVSVGIQMGHATATVAAPSEERASGLMSELRDLLPAPDPSGRQEVTVTFWTYGPHGPQPAWRTISVPDWAQIETNYSARARAELGRLMTSFSPAHGGQLVLWHGEAGTGKTFALRALAWEWRDWCDLNYIVDPDSFFGQHADYLMHVLLQSEWQQSMAWTGYGSLGVSTADVGQVVEAPEAEDGEGTRAAKDWRLLVLEDTGELLQPDAKAIIGQGLARFLNVVDGLIGQGLRILVLVTTNEEIRKLHPAVARPGRCAADIQFSRLTEDEASAWLDVRGSNAEPGRARTLAELYAMLAGEPEPLRSEPFVAEGDRVGRGEGT